MQDKKFYTGVEAAKLASQRGLRLSHRTLAKYRTLGGGPDAYKFGRYVLYHIDALNAWFEARLSKPQRSSSDKSQFIPEVPAN
ncbi:MAG: hypothetical protein ACOVP3_01225 [Rhodoluna sp.]|jgi:hypothetical protein